MKLKINSEAKKKIDAMRLSLSDVLDVFDQERLIGGECPNGCAQVCFHTCIGKCHQTCDGTCTQQVYDDIPVI